MSDFVSFSVILVLSLILVMAESFCSRVKFAFIFVGSVNVIVLLVNGLSFLLVIVVCSLVISTLLAIKLFSVTLRLICVVSVFVIKFIINCLFLSLVIDVVIV